MTNLYDMLGIKPDASKIDVKKAYKQRAGKLHPDKPNGDTEQFKALNNAYTILSDDGRREHYDQTGSTDKPKDHLSDARINLSQIFLRIIASDRKGDIVEMVIKDITDSINQAKQNRNKVEQVNDKFNLLIDRVESTTDNNIYNDMLYSQINQNDQQIKGFDDFIKVGDLMLIILEDYNDSKPDVAEYTTFTTTRTYR